jgi:prevent-host-death family protein
MAGQTRPALEVVMVVDSVTEAKAQLSALLVRVQNGEEVIISRAGKPIASLVPYQADRRRRQPGALRGKVRIAPDFDQLPDDLAAAFGVKEP